MPMKHKVFISYHHKNDEYYRNKFEELFGDLFINKCVHQGDINPNLKTDYIKRLIREDYISDSSVVLVLLGTKTYCRKHVDWEIYAGLRKKAGLLGLILPTNEGYKKNEYNPNKIPPRLNDNLESKYSKIFLWTEDKNKMKNRIESAFSNKKRKDHLINNSRKQFMNNRCE